MQLNTLIESSSDSLKSPNTTDKFSPFVASETRDFLLPEDQITIESEIRTANSEIYDFEYRSGPPYLSTCYDEFSRHFVTVNVAKSSSSAITLIKNEDDEVEKERNLNILRSYHPGYSEWNSTFRKLPQNSRHLLSGKVFTDTNLVMKIKKCQVNGKAFEPIFGSICLYTFLGDDLLRISETFHFDGTPESIRKQYSCAYFPQEEGSAENPSWSFSGTSINVADGSGAQTHMNMFSAVIPEELRDKDLFMVVQLSKILSTDADKAVAPYYLRGTPPDLDKHKDACKRLVKFRQPLAIGVARINDCLQRGKTEVRCPMYAQKLCVSEGFIAQSIKEMYPSGDAAPYYRMDVLDVEMQLTLHDLGVQSMVGASMKEQGLALTMKAAECGLSPAPSNKPSTPSGRNSGNVTVLPRIYPSQIQSERSPLRYSTDLTDLSVVARNSSKLVIRQVMPLLPLSIGKEVTRQFKTGVDNSLFVYPIQLERFQNRNLCLKMELVELTATSALTTKTILTAPYVVLRNIYNSNSIVGPLFVDETYSRVSYHVKNPVLTDEFKVRLPDVLTGRHWLRFTVLHIHVKPTVGRTSLLSSLIRSSIDKVEVESLELGVGMIPLMVNGGECLVEDKEYSVPMNLPNSEVTTELPFIRVRTRTVSSLVSSDSRVQAMLRHHPCPLGALPSSIMSSDTAAEILLNHRPPTGSSDARLVTATQELTKASAVELSRHFLVVMRQLLRTLTAGSGVFDELYSNPYKHTKARSQAFLTILQVIGKIASDANAATSSGELSQEKEFLNAYVDFLFDEEVPVVRVHGHGGDAAEVVPLASTADSSSSKPSISVQKLDLGLLQQDKSDTGEDSIPISARSDATFNTASDGVSANDVVLLDPRGALLTSKSTASASNYHLISPNNKRFSTAKGFAVLTSTTEEEDFEISRNSASEVSAAQELKREGSSQSLVSTSTVGSTRDGTKKPSKVRQNSTNSVTDEIAQAAPDMSEEVEPSRERLASNASFSSSSPEGDFIAEPTTPDKFDGAVDTDSPLQSPETETETIQHGPSAEDSAERRSWGKYITDAIWSSGRLQSLSEILSGDAEACQLGEAFLDDIASHIVLQAERIVVERLVSVAALAMASQVHFNSNRLLEHKMHTVDEELVLAGKRFKVPRSVSASHCSMPFKNEKLWFEAVDAGESVDRLDLTVSPGTSDASPAFFCKQSCEESSVDSIFIQPILPRYDSIDGYRERAARITDSRALVAAGQDTDCQWWPWLYEVIVYQWGAVLALILSASNLISSNNIESIVGSYPYEFEFFQSKADGQRETRSLLMEHGPVLLKIMFKSLALRVAREHRRPPVALDDQFLNALENLVMLLAVEAVSFKTGLWRSRKLVLSLANFLRSLFALVVPNQVIRLVRTFFRAVRKSKADVDAADLRLQMLEEISLFDHFVAVNFPYTLDAPLALFAFSSADASFPITAQSTVAYTSAGFRSTHYLPPFALAHMLIVEVMSLYKQEERKIKSAALEVLRDLLVRHTYDARFQSLHAQQRLVCMYLPLMKEIVDETDTFGVLRFDALDRKEVLAMLLYILQNMPRKVLRHRSRVMCGAATVDSPDKNLAQRSFPSQSALHSSSPRIVSLRNRPVSTTNAFGTNYLGKTTFSALPVNNLLQTLHLILDTFELPTSALNATASKIDVSQLSQVLSPDVLLAGDEVVLDAAVNPSNSQLSLNNRRAAGDAGSQAPRMGIATSLLANLDQRMQTRKIASNVVRKSITTGPVAGVASGRLSGGDDRKWIEHARKMAVDTSKPIPTQALSRLALLSASKDLCCSATQVVIDVLGVLLEECPPCLVSPVPSQDAYVFVLRDSNIEESMLVGIQDLRIVDFTKMALGVLLHALFCNQQSSSVVALFATASSVVRQFGAKIFLVSVEDSLQDWMRIALFHCAAQDVVARDAACNFVLLILRSCHHYVGSFSLVSTTVLAVIQDVLTEVLDCNRAVISTHSDEDRILQGLNESVEKMHSAARARYADNSVAMETASIGSYVQAGMLSYYQAVCRLMTDLKVVLLASADLRRYVSHPVGYDFLGANMLDGPFDDRASVLTQAMRQQRKSVKPDVSAAAVGVQIEEVMMHFVQAAEVFDPIKLPRFRMQWLENLARLHELRSNRAEGAEIRWRIFQICQAVEDTWQVQWVPRPPLEWTKRGNLPVDHSLSDLGASQPALSPHSVKGADANADRNFFNLFCKAMDGRPYRAWSSNQQYLKHMETALAVATERFCNINLIHLAERTSAHLIQLYRLSKQVELMLAEYNRIFQAFRAMSDKGITSAMAVGTFYRVFYEGQGAPNTLRGKEFIFRNANHLHVSEFQTLVVSHLKSIIAEGVEVKSVQDISTVAKNLDDPRSAYMVMNSVKLIVNRANKMSFRALNSTSQRPASLTRQSGLLGDGGSSGKSMEALNQVQMFQYSVPFTKDPAKAHAKRIDEQWLRTTILTVKEPFPYILTRQLVCKREIRDYCPIEVAINDIEERIESMEVELERVSKNASDNNNLMRIVQGTVLPQVNGGAAEVAKVFLSPHKLISNNIHLQMQIEATKMAESAEGASSKSVGGDLAAASTLADTAAGKTTLPSAQDLSFEDQRMRAATIKLKITLVDFLTCSKLLLAKSRRVLIADTTQDLATSSTGPENTAASSTVVSKSTNSVNANKKNETPASGGGAVGAVASPVDQSHVVWQTEMERGFETLVQSIMPFVRDHISDAAAEQFQLSSK